MTQEQRMHQGDLGLTCLLVEDEAAHALLIADCLRTLGFAVHVSETQTHALDKLARQQFDLVILDMGIPDGSGQEILDWLNTRHSPPPILFVTSDDLAEHAVRAIRSGAGHYIVKRPNYLDEVRAAVLELIPRRARAPRELFLDQERSKLLAALNQNQWNVSATARALGMSRGKLRGKMKTLGLE